MSLAVLLATATRTPLTFVIGIVLLLLINGLRMRGRGAGGIGSRDPLARRGSLGGWARRGAGTPGDKDRPAS